MAGGAHSGRDLLLPTGYDLARCDLWTGSKNRLALWNALLKAVSQARKQFEPEEHPNFVCMGQCRRTAAGEVCHCSQMTSISALSQPVRGNVRHGFVYDRDHEDACAKRVLAVAGIKNPTLDADWGGIMQAASGWTLSGPEYLAFVRLLRVRPPSLFTPEIAEFLCTPDGKWMQPERTAAYTLGVVIEGPGPTFLHSGGHNWKQDDAAGGPIDEARGTSFVLLPDGIAWFASYDGISAGTNPEATAELRQELCRACEQVRPCPAIDKFPGIGIGPVWC
jgi:hypothetical protein